MKKSILKISSKNLPSLIKQKSKSKKNDLLSWSHEFPFDSITEKNNEDPDFLSEKVSLFFSVGKVPFEVNLLNSIDGLDVGTLQFDRFQFNCLTTNGKILVSNYNRGMKQIFSLSQNRLWVGIILSQQEQETEQEQDEGEDDESKKKKKKKKTNEQELILKFKDETSSFIFWKTFQMYSWYQGNNIQNYPINGHILGEKMELKSIFLRLKQNSTLSFQMGCESIIKNNKILLKNNLINIIFKVNEYKIEIHFDEELKNIKNNNQLPIFPFEFLLSRYRLNYTFKLKKLKINLISNRKEKMKNWELKFIIQESQIKELIFLALENLPFISNQLNSIDNDNNTENKIQDNAKHNNEEETETETKTEKEKEKEKEKERERERERVKDDDLKNKINNANEISYHNNNEILIEYYSFYLNSQYMIFQPRSVNTLKPSYKGLYNSTSIPILNKLKQELNEKQAYEFEVMVLNSSNDSIKGNSVIKINKNNFQIILHQDKKEICKIHFNYKKNQEKILIISHPNYSHIMCIKNLLTKQYFILGTKSIYERDLITSSILKNFNKNNLIKNFKMATKNENDFLSTPKSLLLNEFSIFLNEKYLTDLGTENEKLQTKKQKNKKKYKWLNDPINTKYYLSLLNSKGIVSAVGEIILGKKHFLIQINSKQLLYDYSNYSKLFFSSKKTLFARFNLNHSKTVFIKFNSYEQRYGFELDFDEKLNNKLSYNIGNNNDNIFLNDTDKHQGGAINEKNVFKCNLLIKKKKTFIIDEKINKIIIKKNYLIIGSFTIEIDPFLRLNHGYKNENSIIILEMKSIGKYYFKFYTINERFRFVNKFYRKQGKMNKVLPSNENINSLFVSKFDDSQYSWRFDTQGMVFLPSLNDKLEFENNFQNNGLNPEKFMVQVLLNQSNNNDNYNEEEEDDDDDEDETNFKLYNRILVLNNQYLILQKNEHQTKTTNEKKGIINAELSLINLKIHEKNEQYILFLINDYLNNSMNEIAIKFKSPKDKENFLLKWEQNIKEYLKMQSLQKLSLINTVGEILITQNGLIIKTNDDGSSNNYHNHRRPRHMELLFDEFKLLQSDKDQFLKLVLQNTEFIYFLNFYTRKEKKFFFNLIHKLQKTIKYNQTMNLYKEAIKFDILQKRNNSNVETPGNLVINNHNNTLILKIEKHEIIKKISNKIIIQQHKILENILFIHLNNKKYKIKFENLKEKKNFLFLYNFFLKKNKPTSILKKIALYKIKVPIKFVNLEKDIKTNGIISLVSPDQLIIVKNNKKIKYIIDNQISIKERKKKKKKKIDEEKDLTKIRLNKRVIFIKFANGTDKDNFHMQYQKLNNYYQNKINKINNPNNNVNANVNVTVTVNGYNDDELNFNDILEFQKSRNEQTIKAYDSSNSNLSSSSEEGEEDDDDDGEEEGYGLNIKKNKKITLNDSDSGSEKNLNQSNSKSNSNSDSNLNLETEEDYTNKEMEKKKDEKEKKEKKKEKKENKEKKKKKEKKEKKEKKKKEKKEKKEKEKKGEEEKEEEKKIIEIENVYRFKIKLTKHNGEIIFPGILIFDEPFGTLKIENSNKEEEEVLWYSIDPNLQIFRNKKNRLLINLTFNDNRKDFFLLFESSLECKTAILLLKRSCDGKMFSYLVDVSHNVDDYLGVINIDGKYLRIRKRGEVDLEERNGILLDIEKIKIRKNPKKKKMIMLSTKKYVFTLQFVHIHRLDSFIKKFLLIKKQLQNDDPLLHLNLDHRTLKKKPKIIKKGEFDLYIVHSNLFKQSIELKAEIILEPKHLIIFISNGKQFKVDYKHPYTLSNIENEVFQRRLSIDKFGYWILKFEYITERDRFIQELAQKYNL
ncbi:chascon [Anaeramoeba flamelloides]|uniref:Chascon n=1 Tax=Anaeramoeba flamelloides TaxID=1746091 RepID=A0ABQ8YU62_9EUKA|nr:chascon [Anaeramoeba flamelloides]